MNSLKSMRQARGMTQIKLGELVGVSASSISQYEKGTKKPSVDIALKLAEVLDCDVADILGRSQIKIGGKSSFRAYGVGVESGNEPKQKNPATESDGKNDSSNNEVDAFATSLFRQLPIERKIFLITQMQAELQNLSTQGAPEESD